ncbi:MAG TPA: DUF721 domain-containing protein [Syntrophales bacterium]|nr:DUF721 domain-containing protein [Syntrophales bacterium]HON24109.1 DUF721 domain-containing protein [Syntrophales bacterium]HOU77353.1 DUF721 domain-containing protein [Syntrophales bacterium]HPC32644.1 DUF721 domain-containing protein [Syntrophales bacterium]HQG33958.1 DUF721 domain-containing protein [Syntrophales bacterium]
MARRRLRYQPAPLGEVLQSLMKKQGVPLTTGDVSLRRIWNEAVGDQIAAQTAPETVKRGILMVKVSSSVWMHHLQFLKKDILQRFNSLYGKGDVRELKLSLGVTPAPPANVVPAADPAAWLDALNARDKRLIKESLDAVGDPELRGILRRVMTREISRRRFLEKRKGR